MKTTYCISYEKAGVSQICLVKAESKEDAESYFKSIKPSAVVYAVGKDNGEDMKPGCPIKEVPDGWKAEMGTYPNLTAAVNAYYDSQIEKFRRDLETITVEAVTGRSYYTTYTTPTVYQAIQRLPRDQILPDWIKDKMLAKFQRINNKEREKKLQKLADVAATPSLKSASITVDWKRNPTWGHNPTAEVKAGDWGSVTRTVGKASGYGYDKESAAIASAMNVNLAILRAMYDHAEKGGTFPYSVYTTAGLPWFDGGCGVSCFRKVFEAMGYKWHDIAHGKTYDVYSVERV